MAELLDELPRAGPITFARLTASLVERLDVIVRFLAVLELFKQGMLELDQTDRPAARVRSEEDRVVSSHRSRD